MSGDWVEQVKSILSSKDKWTGAAYCRDEQGYKLEPESSKAVAWSLYGAIFKVAKDDSEYEKMCQIAYDSYKSIYGQETPLFWHYWHDDSQTTFEDIQKVMDKMEELSKYEQVQ